MNKRIAICLLFSAILSVPVYAGVEVDSFVSYTSFDQAGESLGIGVRLEWLVNDAVSLDVGFTGLEDSNLTPSTGLSGNISVLPIDMGARYRFGNGFYAGAGASWVKTDASNVDIDDEVGFYAVGGWAKVYSNGIGYFGEIAYRDVSVNIVGTNVDLGGPIVNVGAKFKF
jgi:hypothetical protein